KSLGGESRPAPLAVVRGDQVAARGLRHLLGSDGAAALLAGPGRGGQLPVPRPRGRAPPGLPADPGRRFCHLPGPDRLARVYAGRGGHAGPARRGGLAKRGPAVAHDRRTGPVVLELDRNGTTAVGRARPAAGGASPRGRLLRL